MPETTARRPSQRGTEIKGPEGEICIVQNDLFYKE